MKRLLIFAALLPALSAQPPNLAVPDFSRVEIQTLHVQGSVYMLVGGGGNVTVQAGNDGALLVDTNFAPLAPKIMAAIRKLSSGPVRYVVLTHVHADHTGGTEAWVKLGATPAAPAAALVIAQLNVLNRMVSPGAGNPPVPQPLWPNDTYSAPYKDFFFNNEAIVVTHLPNAHTDGDSIVFFRRSDVLSVGDVFEPDVYPFIDLARGGSAQGLIDGLNKILEIAVPAKYQEGGTLIVPGHGRLCDEADVVEYRDMVTIVRDRVQDLIKQGKTLDQVKAAKLSRDYDTQYSTEGGFVTPDSFVESIYRSLKK
jgi:glyoxylase-like metal-dependent hydrolase (beta-lactamase superfamily II)